MTLCYRTCIVGLSTAPVAECFVCEVILKIVLTSLDDQLRDFVLVV